MTQTSVAAMVPLPVIWLLGGIAVALFGLAPRLRPWSWGIFGFFILLALFGDLLNFPQWALDLSPFNHVLKAPAEELTVAPLAWLFTIALALLAAGLAGFRRRDVG